VTLTVTDPTEDLEQFASRLRAACHTELLDMLRTATPEQALLAVQRLSPRELYELPREIVQSWEGDANTPGTARYVRAEKLTNDWRGSDAGTMWRMRDVADAAGVRPDSAGRWRGNFIKQVPDKSRCLPRHDDGIGDVKDAGDDPSSKGGDGIPLWHPSTVLAWLKWSRKIDDDCYRHIRPSGRGGGSPTGRPPKQRDPK
jgi:hypothetical protein